MEGVQEKLKNLFNNHNTKKKFFFQFGLNLNLPIFQLRMQLTFEFIFPLGRRYILWASFSQIFLMLMEVGIVVKRNVTRKMLFLPIFNNLRQKKVNMDDFLLISRGG